MITKEFLNIIKLTKAQTFAIYELVKVVMVYKDKKLIFAAF